MLPDDAITLLPSEVERELELKMDEDCGKAELPLSKVTLLCKFKDFNLEIVRELIVE